MLRLGKTVTSFGVEAAASLRFLSAFFSVWMVFPLVAMWSLLLGKRLAVCAALLFLFLPWLRYVQSLRGGLYRASDLAWIPSRDWRMLSISSPGTSGRGLLLPRVEEKDGRLRNRPILAEKSPTKIWNGGGPVVRPLPSGSAQPTTTTGSGDPIGSARRKSGSSRSARNDPSGPTTGWTSSRSGCRQ